MSSCDIVLRLEKLSVQLKDLVVVLLQELGSEGLVLRQQLLECTKCIGGDIESGDFDVVEEVEEGARIEDDLRESFMTNALSQHGTTLQSNIWSFERKQDINYIGSWR